MDALLVWNTWRRVLASDRLAGWVSHPGARGEALRGLTPDETAIVDDYASTPAATRSNIGMYRRGLVRNALGALDLVPLTRRLLHASGLGAEAVAEDFTRSAGYADDGPNFWRTAAGFVAYLAGRPEFAAPAWQDILALDAATAALARRLGESPAAPWPGGAAAAAGGPRAPREPARFTASRAAVVVPSRGDLTAFLENPLGFDAGAAADPPPRHWLVYFPAAEAPHEYAELSERAARAFDLLRTPLTAAGLSRALGGLPREDVLAVIGSLAGLGVIAGEAGAAAPAAAGDPGPTAPAGRPALAALARGGGAVAR